MQQSKFVRRHTRAAAFRRLSGAIALAGIAACDIPMAAPVLEQRWIVPAETSRISVASLLPSGVSILPDSSGFTVNGNATTVSRPLSDDCALCSAANGFTGPKPALIVTASTSSLLASDISAATLTGGSLALSVTSNYTFDPLRPNGNAAPYGSATITVTNGATVLGSVTIDGASQALPANGGKLNVSIPLAGVISGDKPVTVMMSVNSPAGSPVTMDASRTIVVAATPMNLKVANANVIVAGRNLNSTSSMDLSDISDGIAKRVLRGSLLLAIANPFAVSSPLTVCLQPDGGTAITKAVQLTAGSSSQTIAFTQAELKALFGHNVTITISGAANATNGAVNVSPKQAVIVTSRFDVTLEIGG